VGVPLDQAGKLPDVGTDAKLIALFAVLHLIGMDARAARVRLRQPGRLADLLPAPPRRPAHAPSPPPVPARGRRRPT
jgi:hypothetical protein